jgi:nitrite reductase/ring-hydroxylating ferredoxin subunit
VTEHTVIERRPRTLEGTAYGRGPQASNDTLVRVGPGTPCGEYMRRFWQPVARSADATPRPRKVRLLGEDLILFRDGAGKPGLLYPRCMHRGTTLYYGHVEERGIRCCYHGWLFDVEGNCLEQPCEPEGGIARANHRQPWYPVQERYGLVFAYMGPPDRMPLLPKFDILEDIGADEELVSSGGPGLGYGDSRMNGRADYVPYNWLQVFENIMDPFHVYVLHSTFSGAQFAEGFKVMPTVKFEDHPLGTVYHAYRDLPDGRSMVRTSVAMLPHLAAVPSVAMEPGHSRNVFWHLPIDDANFIHFTVTVRKKGAGGGRNFGIPLTPDGRAWLDLTEEEHQDYPGDFEAQWGQGEITFHSEEHLVRSDIGIGMLRRKLLEQIKLVQDGGDPIGVTFTPGEETIRIDSGNFFDEAPKA